MTPYFPEECADRVCARQPELTGDQQVTLARL